MVDNLFDVRKKDLADLPVRRLDLDCRFAERLSAPQVVDAAANAFAVNIDDLDIIAVEHLLKDLHDCKKIAHLIAPESNGR